MHTGLENWGRIGMELCLSLNHVLRRSSVSV